MQQTPFCIVTTTTDRQELAKQIADALLTQQLAACIQILPIESHYRWEGDVAESKEFLLQIKTKTALFPKIEKLLLSLHTYTTPEIIVTPITDGNQAYLSWINAEVL